MSRSRFPTAWVLLALSGLLAVSILLPTGSSVEKNVGSHPFVTDGHKTLNNANVTDPSGRFDRLSGLRNNVFTIRFAGSSTTELMKCDPPGQDPPPAVYNKMRYTLDGTKPDGNSPAVELTCTTDPPPPPASQQTYRATLTPAKFSSAPLNATVTFMFEIVPAGGQASLIEPPYKYYLDRTTPNITNRVPTPVEGASISAAVTKNERTAISFRVFDNFMEAPLEPASINVTVDGGVASTKHFDCSMLTPWNATCALNYAKLSSTFKWAEGEHTVTVRTNDTTRNNMKPADATYKFRVDLKAPNVTNVVANPQSVATAAPQGGLPMTGRGSKITVSADVTDLNMNTKSQGDVVAQLYNTTRNLQSDFFPMKFVSGTKWESTSVTIPNTWPTGIYSAGVRVQADDMGGNRATNTTGSVNSTGSFRPRDAFIIDASGPQINETLPPNYIKAGTYTVRANITDEGAGLDKTKVKVRFLNLTGNFETAPTGTTKVGQYHEATMQNPNGDHFTYTLPAAKDGAIIVYFILATDKANVTTTTDAHSLRADGTPPLIREVDQRAFRAPPTNVFRAEVTDLISGVNETGVKLLYNFGGNTFKTVVMTREGSSNIFRGAANFTGATDGSTMQYFFEAEDIVRNKGNLSSASSPRTAKVDLKPPVSTLSAPATSTGEKFTVTWNATDVGSGVESFTVQARVKGNTEWIIVAEDTLSRSLDFCGEGNRTYEMRVYARDRGGNVEVPKADPMASTQVIGPGCQEVITVRVLTPTIGQRIDGRTNGTVVTYAATSTSSVTPTRYLKIAIIFSPDDGAHYYTLAANENNSGVFRLDLKGLPSCRVCLIKVQATSLSGIKGEATSVPFEILNGSPQVDLDGNGLPDSWELRYGRTLGTYAPGADNDKDGLTNTQESQVGTSPTSSDTDGDGASDRAEVRAGFNPLSAQSVPGREFTRQEEYTNWYWVVPGLFLGTAILFFAGLARRW